MREEKSNAVHPAHLLEYYDLSGKKLSQQRSKEQPEKVATNGQLVCGTFLDDPLLYRPDAFDSYERVLDRFEQPAESYLESELWSSDFKQRVLILKVKNKRLPDQDFWAALLHHDFPESRREF